MNWDPVQRPINGNCMYVHTLRSPSLPWLTDGAYSEVLHEQGRSTPNVVLLRAPDPRGQFSPASIRSLLGLPSLDTSYMGFTGELSCGYEVSP